MMRCGYLTDLKYKMCQTEQNMDIHVRYCDIVILDTSRDANNEWAIMKVSQRKSGRQWLVGA